MACIYFLWKADVLSPLAFLCAYGKFTRDLFPYLSVFILGDFLHSVQIHLPVNGREDVYFAYLIGAPAHISPTIGVSCGD